MEKRLKIDTKLVSPSVYMEVGDPNTIELNNSYSSYYAYDNGNNPHYKRENGMLNYRTLLKVVSSVYNVNVDNCALFSSGVGVASMISASKIFNRILVLKGTYPEMTSAWGYGGNSQIIDETYSDFQKDDLLCFETIEIPSCKVKDYTYLIERAKSCGAKICVDNTIPTWINNDCKKYDADFIIESLSKFGNGMNTSLIGFLYCKSLENKEKIVYQNRVYGFYPHPFDCYLTQLGMETFSLRMNKIKENTQKIIECINKFHIKENIDYTCHIESGIIFIKSKNPEFKMPKLSIIQHADTFGAPFTVTKAWLNDKNIVEQIRISVGLENFEDILVDILHIIKNAGNKISI